MQNTRHVLTFFLVCLALKLGAAGKEENRKAGEEHGPLRIRRGGRFFPEHLFQFCFLG